MGFIGLLLFLMPFILVYGAYLVYGRDGIFAFVQNKLVYNTHISQSSYKKMDAYLSANSAFFKQLSIPGKAKFINRLLHFNHDKIYVGEEGLVITEEMQWLVASSAIQLTFGLDHYLMENLKGFKIYPSIFYLKMMKNYLKGGTPPQGKMMLSWEHVQEGFFYPNDRYNLALHEMGHSLKLTIKYADDFDSHFYRYIEDWKKIGRVEFLKMKRENDNFLRSYAATNMHEFFAVCVEHFFEVPDQFKENLPEIYTEMTKLLKLDPLNGKSDFKITVSRFKESYYRK